MATYGNSTTPSSGYFFDDTGNSQFWSSYGAFPGGIVTELHVYASGDLVTTTENLCIWGTSSLLYSSGSVGVGAGTRAIGGQGWAQVLGINLYIPAQTLNLGFWSPGHVAWTFEGSGSTAYQHSLSGGPGTLSPGGNEGSGQLGAYIVYTPGNGHVMRSGSFAAGPGTVVRGGVQTNGVFFVMRGGTWVQGN